MTIKTFARIFAGIAVVACAADMAIRAQQPAPAGAAGQAARPPLRSL